MLNCLHSNKTLKRLELAGNNVPSDILKAVGKYYLLHRKESVTAISPLEGFRTLAAPEES